MNEEKRPDESGDPAASVTIEIRVQVLEKTCAELVKALGQIAERMDDRTHVAFQRLGPDGKAWQAGVVPLEDWPVLAASDPTAELVGGPTTADVALRISSWIEDHANERCGKA